MYVTIGYRNISSNKLFIESRLFFCCDKYKENMNSIDKNLEDNTV